MAQLPDRVLSWLWTVLQPYRHPRSTYSDTVSVLSVFPSLQPRTAVYTYEDGHSALLLCLGGTLPVDFRGTLYRYPVELWLPEEYGERGTGVICYVRPDGGKTGSKGDFVTRPGQHVAVDGRVYHPYLRDWGTRERSNIVDFLRILQDVFAKEPPIVARQHHQQFRQPSQSSDRPTPPPKQRPGSSQPVEMPGSTQPPPLPAKPGQLDRSTSVIDTSGPRASNGPPLPPLPHERRNGSYQADPRTPPASSHGPPRIRNDEGHFPQPDGRYHGVPSPVPPTAQNYQHQRVQPNEDRSPVSPLSPDNRVELPGSKYERPPPLPQVQLQPTLHSQYQARLASHQTQRPPQQYTSRPTHYQNPATGQQQYQQSEPNYAYQQQHLAPRSQPQQFQAQQAPTAKPPPPDLLTDPFDISLPGSSTNSGPAPPIPPNPEREHLLSMLSSTLISQLNTQLQQNMSAMAPLLAQQAALQEAHNRLNAELAQLEHLDQALSVNESILHESLHECDAVIKSSKSMLAPNIDEVLVAPTVASQQLWTLCADEAAIREALWCLQRAVGAGRVGGAEFVKLTRGLAREAFLKMALIRKVAKGLGLDLGAAGHAVA